MNKSGPVILIEDDKDDQELFSDVFNELNYGNEIIFFDDGFDALKFLITAEVEPFIIISDINMPKLNGMELRDTVNNNENLRIKCIPYLLFSTIAEQKDVVEAYSKSIQGFFIKPSSYAELKQTMQKIMEYWKECLSPNYIKNA